MRYPQIFGGRIELSIGGEASQGLYVRVEQARGNIPFEWLLRLATEGIYHSYGYVGCLRRKYTFRMAIAVG
eukprot:1190609-Prorocentrum_minimum.AAC.3